MKANIPKGNPDASHSSSRPTSGRKLSGKRTEEQLEQPNGVEQANKLEPANEVVQRYSGIHRSSTAPTSSAGIVPTQRMSVDMPREIFPGAESIDRPYRRPSEADLRVTTIHLHLNEEQYEVCRCLLDTGADLNFVSQQTLDNSQLPFVPRVPREVPSVTVLGGSKIQPIGSIRLTWHIDNHAGQIYSDDFWVISNIMRPPFDVLLGHRWIKEQRAFKRNSSVLLASLPFA